MKSPLDVVDASVTYFILWTPPIFEYVEDDLPRALKWIVEEVDSFEEVMSTQGYFCAMVASYATTSFLEKVGCSHAKIVGKVNFGISIDDMTFD